MEPNLNEYQLEFDVGSESEQQYESGSESQSGSASEYESEYESSSEAESGSDGLMLDLRASPEGLRDAALAAQERHVSCEHLRAPCQSTTAVIASCDEAGHCSAQNA